MWNSTKSGLSVSELAEKRNLARCTLCDWINAFERFHEGKSSWYISIRVKSYPVTKPTSHPKFFEANDLHSVSHSTQNDAYLHEMKVDKLVYETSWVMAFQYIIKSGRHIWYPFPLSSTRTISLMPSLMVARFSPSFYHQRGLSPSKTKRKDDGESEIYKSVWHQLPKCRLPFLLFLILEKLGEAIFKGRTHVEFEEGLL